MGFFLTIVLLIFAVIFGPIVTIWSLNELFPMLAIPYTFWTWLATVCLFGFVHGNSSK